MTTSLQHLLKKPNRLNPTSQYEGYKFYDFVTLMAHEASLYHQHRVTDLALQKSSEYDILSEGLLFSTLSQLLKLTRKSLSGIVCYRQTYVDCYCFRIRNCGGVMVTAVYNMR